jgi:alpha-galactosidase
MPSWFGRLPAWLRILIPVLLVLAFVGAVTVAMNRSDHSEQALDESACSGLYDRFNLPERKSPAVDPSQPVMGWNPYNYKGTKATQEDMLGAASAMAHNGMQSAGYSFVNLDDGWQGPRDSTTHAMSADGSSYSCGLDRLSNFLHAHGFNFGIYTSASEQSCGGRAGSGNNVEQDVRQFAQWDVDLIKLDWCGADYTAAAVHELVGRWQKATRAAGRPMILMVNAGGAPVVLRQLGDPDDHTGQANAFRVEGDICPVWTYPPGSKGCGDPKFHLGVLEYLMRPDWKSIAELSGPGHFADPDMLEVGNGDLGYDEAQTQFSMWAMWSAPLVAGNNVASMNGRDGASKVLLNRSIIAVDQDKLGQPARLIATRDGVQYWRKAVMDGAVVAAVNVSDKTAPIKITTADADLADAQSAQDLWSRDTFPTKPGSYFSSTLRPHAVRVMKFLRQ